jgi:3-hydroxypropanoate dehydrogenase
VTDLLDVTHGVAAPAASPAASATRTRIADDALAALFTDARTARTFADTPVSDEQLAAIWELARWAPTASNLQPLRVVYVQSPEARERLVSHMADGNKARIASAPAVALLAVDTRFHEYVPTVLPTRPEMEQSLAGNDDLRSHIGDFNSAMQAGYFVLATRAQGLAAGPMGGFDKAATDADFFPDGRLRSILVVAIGHPGVNPWHARQPRLDPAEAVAWV